MVNQEVVGWDVLETLVVYARRNLGMTFKMRMERGLKWFEVVSKLGKGVWRE